MTGIEFLASFLRTGRLHGIGIGSTLDEVGRAVRHRFVDVADEEGRSLRRDYGFVEFYFNPGDEWVMSGGSVIVVDDEEEERGCHAGHGDVWSVSLWAPVRAS